MPQKIEDVFNECLDAILAGKTVEECLTEHPDMAEALRPLLEMSATMNRSIAGIEPAPELKTSVMLRLDEALQARQKHQRRPLFRGWPSKYATAIAGVCALLIVGIVSVNASAQSQPDDLLYPVKLTAEQARLAFTFSEPARADLRLRLAETRVNELAYLAGKGDMAAIDGVIQTLESNLDVPSDQSAVTATGGLLTAPAPRAVIPAPSPAPALPPAPRPMTEAAPSISSTADASETAADAGKAMTPLARSQSKSLAILEETLKTAPDPAKPAIQQAITRVKRAYEQAIDKAAR